MSPRRQYGMQASPLAYIHTTDWRSSYKYFTFPTAAFRDTMKHAPWDTSTWARMYTNQRASFICTPNLT